MLKTGLVMVDCFLCIKAINVQNCISYTS